MNVADLVMEIVKAKGIPEDWIIKLWMVPDYDAWDVQIRVSGVEQEAFVKKIKEMLDRIQGQ